MNSNVSMKDHIDPAIVIAEDENPSDKFITAIANHRVWDLEIERNSRN